MPHSKSVPLRLVVALAMAASGTLSAQQPPAWNDLQPPGGVDPAKLLLAPPPSKVALYRDGQYMRVFSSVLGRWHAHTPSFGTSPLVLRDYVLVPESDRWTGFSAYRGVFEVLFTDYATTTMTTGDTMALARRGTDAHVFSAFTGHWHTHTVPSSWVPFFGERVLSFQPPFGHPGLPLVFDALTGAWHQVAAPATDVVIHNSSSGSSALALLRRADSSVYAAKWSTHFGGWQYEDVTLPPPPSPFDPSAPGQGFADGDLHVANGLVFSGLTGAIQSLGGTANLVAQGQLAAAVQPNGNLWCIGITGSAWVPIPAGANFWFNATVPLGTRLFQLGTQTVAFSGITNTIATANIDVQSPAYYEQRELVGMAIDQNTGGVGVYSATTGQWHQVPADVLPQQPRAGAFSPFASNDAVLLPTTTGYVAFSGRTGAFVPLVATGLGRDAVHGLVGNATTVWIFDGKTDRWVSAPKSAGAMLPPIATEHSYVFVDGLRATAYSRRAGRFATVALTEPASAAMTLDDGGLVLTANHILACSGAAGWSAQAFPIDYSPCAPATTWRHQLRIAAGDLAFVGLGQPLAAPIALPGVGELWLDPNNLVLLLGASVAPGEERHELTVPVPALPFLHNTRWFTQALVFPTAGSQYLTPPTELFLL